MKNSTRSIEDVFRANANVLFKDVRRLRENLAKKESRLKLVTIGPITHDDEEKGPHYEANILRYIEALDEIKKNNTQRISIVGKRVTRLIHDARRTLSPRKANNFRRDILLAYCGALEPLGGRPSKKVAALLVDEHDRIINWDVNHLCYGIVYDIKLFVKGAPGGRGPHTWCAERNNIASHLNCHAVTPKTSDIPAVHAALDHFTLSLVNQALQHPGLAKATLVCSHYPCVICAEVLAPARGTEKGRRRILREIITVWNPETEGRLTNPNRRTAQASRILEAGGIRITLRMSPK